MSEFESVPTNVLDVARGLDIRPDGSTALGASSIERTHATAVYFHKHRPHFEEAYEEGTGGIIVASGGYPTMATGHKIAPPPLAEREGSRMYELLVGEYEVPARHVVAVNSPRTTLEVVLHPWQQGHFQAVTEDNPLLVATHESQWPRIKWFARRIFKLPAGAVQILAVPGEDDPAIIAEELSLLKKTKILYGPARTPEGLLRAEKIADRLSSLAMSLHLQKPPAEKYLDLGDS